MGMSIMLIFICLGIATIIIKSITINIILILLPKIDTMQDSITTDCTQKDGVLYEIDSMYTSGDSILCSSSCPCDADSSLWPETIAVNMVTSTMGQSTLTDCPVDGISDYDDEHYVGILEALETTFKCAGMCTIPTFYLFSDVA